MIRTAYTCNALKLSQFFLASIPAGRDDTKALSRAFAARLGVDEQTIFPMAAGRMGLYLFMKAAGIGQGDEVIVPAYTCVVVTNAVKYTGATVIYADLAEGEVNPGIEEISEKVSDRTRLIVIPHNYGIPFGDVQELKLRHPGILVIEDAAHTIASISKEGKKTGTLGDAAFFSFEFSKPVTSGLGGVLVVNNNALLEKTRDAYLMLEPVRGFPLFRQWITLLVHLITSYPRLVFLKGAGMRVLKSLGWLGATASGELEGELPPSYPLRLSTIQARWVMAQLKDYDAVVRHIKNLTDLYTAALSGIPGIGLFPAEGAVLLRYPVLLPWSRHDDRGRQLSLKLRKAGILPGEWFNDVVHPLGSYAYCYQSGSCRIGEAYAQQMMNLPLGIHIRLNKKSLHNIRAAFLSVLEWENSHEFHGTNDGGS